jgi:hypothetical protein
MNYRTKQALRELGCRIFGHRWHLFSAEVYIDYREITFSWFCARCRQIEFPTVPLPMTKPPKRTKRG